MRYLTVFITRDDIKAGKRHSVCECPTAIAMTRALRTDNPTRNPKVRVGRHLSYMCRGNVVRTMAPSKGLQDWIRTFDGLGPDRAKPFSFQITI